MWTGNDFQAASLAARSVNPQNRPMPIILRFLLLPALLFWLPIHLSLAEADYPPAVKTIVEHRCMVCHGCYDAPCQLKLDAWAGLDRGASKDKVYDGTRLLPANLTRLFEDAHSTSEWRTKGFYPVLAEKDANTAGVAQKMLQLKQDNPLPAVARLPDSFDFALNRDQQCPKPEEFDDFARDYPLWGMPYGLPGLNEADHDTLSRWLASGAPATARPPAPPEERTAVQRWEVFFNGASLKQRLMSRYIYEHLFAGDLYFSDLTPAYSYYKLVRSRTPPGQPIDIIATRRPYDSPGDRPFFYRLQPLRSAVLDKRHMPYALNKARMQRWRTLFLDAQYALHKLPDYSADVAANPFVAFHDLPVKSRYRFMLDEAQFTIMGFIKGPVCRGQVALNVIDDHFWVAFADPDNIEDDQAVQFLSSQSHRLRLPNADTGLLVSLVDWRKYSQNQLKFLRAKSNYLKRRFDGHNARVDMNLIWHGDGHNDNAALTVFRHNDSASVVKGFVGQQPKTAWIINYSLLERIHYLLVAGFDVYGNVSHQLETRLYMDFLRMEGEQNFLMLMPRETRISLRDFWYRQASDDVKKYVMHDSMVFDRESDIRFLTDNPKNELLSRLQQVLPGARAPRYRVTDPVFKPLQQFNGAPFSLMPEVAFVDVLQANGESRDYTIIRNSGYANNAQLFREAERRIPQEDYVTVVKGFIGSYPNAFFQLPERELPAFVTDIRALRTEQDYANLLSRYGVRRSAPWFWQISDKFNRRYRQEQPVEAGLFDLNRFENR